jgi:hypothetical protein
MIRHTFNISIVNLPVPEAMACDGDVFADSTGVEELGAEQLVAEESGLITGDHGPCWVGEAAGRDESGKGSDGGEDGSEEVHLDSGNGILGWWYQSDLLVLRRRRGDFEEGCVLAHTPLERVVAQYMKFAIARCLPCNQLSRLPQLRSR